jgi:cytochrome c2
VSETEKPKKGPLLHSVTGYDDQGNMAEGRYRSNMRSKAAARLALAWQAEGLRAWIRPPLPREVVLEVARTR